ncbi:MAG: bifunctional phosphoribosylaminoimidazolecarboxamide formyltransferase/IMP cyclohydrolase [Opitutaceae bacterium]|nr:bifunctional phosphoribosylaminoimidazolecarboxamide formyltransferase/IMP cyclohydrolase [Opitutaceae bacterium]
MSDKSGLVEFATALVQRHGFRLLSTGGTARLLAEKGLPVTEVSQHTGFPEIMEGRVKTLHPRIHGGLLCRRDKPGHLAQAQANDIAMIDLVVVNLYPFEQTIAKPGVAFEEAIENIDIGGPSMLRSAAKNHESVTVVCDPADYGSVLAALDPTATAPATLAALRRKLALKVFQRTAGYDAAIAAYLEKQTTTTATAATPAVIPLAAAAPATIAPDATLSATAAAITTPATAAAIPLPTGASLTKPAAITAPTATPAPTTDAPPDLDAIAGLPATLTLTLPKAQSLRYGENPHQHAALYGTFHDHFQQLQGKELSYNNILDITSATHLIGEFEHPTVAILKHTNPCGVASAGTLAEAWENALATDRQAPFGGIIAVNRTLDAGLAERIKEIFTEVIIAPRFSDDALALFSKKKNLRLMVAKAAPGADSLLDIRSVVGGLLVQDRNTRLLGRQADLKVVTRRQPDAAEWASMLFGWRVCKHVKSNAIVYCRGEQTLGIGAGQMARVDSSRIAVWKAGEAGLDLRGSVVASEAMFPFADGLIAAADAGATSAIQPGGSVRDAEVIAAADERGLAMVFTGIRHFKH